jgi:hypothetical protein
MEESILSEFVRADLEKIGFTMYAEVQDHKGSKHRCDMFGRCEDPLQEAYGNTIAFEAKLNFNLKVIEQAYHWKAKKRANFVYIIIPSTNKNLSSRKFARELCSLLGIGVMEVNIVKEQYHVTVQASKIDNPKIPELYKEQKMIIASNAANQYMTPYKRTVSRINDYFKDKQFCYISDIIKNVDHHYKSEVHAARNIKFLIENKVMKGFYLIKKNNKIVIVKITLK